MNNVKGYKVTSRSNSNSIFLPAAAHMVDTSFSVLAGEGFDYGWYFTRTLYLKQGHSQNAYILSSFSGHFGTDEINRYRGLSVRPVLKQ